MAKKTRASKQKPVPFDMGGANSAGAAPSASAPAGSAPRVWGSGTSSLARITGSGPTPVATSAPAPAAHSQEELWPTLGGSSAGSQQPPAKTNPPLQPKPQPQQHQQHQEQAPQARVAEEPRSHLGPVQHNSLNSPEVRAHASVPQLALKPDDAKRKEAWSSNESSPRSPPLTPEASPQRGSRTVDGVVVSPEPIESPKRVLQRWIEAGKPSAAVYALHVTDAEFRGFRRAVSVVAQGEAKAPDCTSWGTGTGTPQQHRKRMRGEEPIDHETAVSLMADLAHIHVNVPKPDTSGFTLSAAACLRPNNSVRCFEFQQIFNPMIMQRA